MKRFLTMVLCFGTSVILSACSWNNKSPSDDDNPGRTKEDVRTYVDASLRTSFYGDYEEYTANQYDTEENAIALYESEIQYYAEAMMYSFNIDSSLSEEETTEEYRKIAKTVLGKAKWEIKSVEYDEYKKQGTIELVLYPVDFLTIMDREIDAVTAELQNKYSAVDAQKCAEEEMTAIRRDYANMVIGVLKKKAGAAGNLEPVRKTYDIDYAEGILREDIRYEIEDILMGFGE